MAAPFRIEKPIAQRLDRDHGAGDDFKEYLGRLLKMIPGEVVGIYMIGSGFIPENHAVALAVWSGVCFLLVILVRIYGTADPNNGKAPQPVPVTVAAIAFVIWLYWLGGPFEEFHIHVPWIGSLAVLLWSFVIPIFYKGEG